VRGQIEQLTAQLKDLNDRAAFATLSARYSVPIVAVEVAKSEWEPGTAVDQALASLISTLQGLTDAAIWFVIVWLPILIVLGLLAGIGIAVARRLGVGRRNVYPPAPPAPPAEMPSAG
jgi:Na+-driven multidrug efflux pump